MSAGAGHSWGVMKHSLIDIPRFREAPEDVVRNCRALVPTAELVYMDDGAWYLGSVERASLRSGVGGLKRERAGRMWKKLEQMRQMDPAVAAKATWMWWEGALLMQGFAGIEVFRGEPDSRVEEFLRRRHYNWQKDIDATIRKHMAEDDQDSRAPETPEERASRYSSLLNEHKLREAHRWAFRQPKSFTSRLQKVPA